MIISITKKRFHQLCHCAFEDAPPDSIAAEVHQRTRETQWFEDPERDRLGVIVYESVDQDWQAIVLKKQAGGYRTHQIEVSLPSEQDAVQRLRQLFVRETNDFQKVLKRLTSNRFYTPAKP